jgi:hypothetical protein
MTSTLKVRFRFHSNSRDARNQCRSQCDCAPVCTECRRFGDSQGSALALSNGLAVPRRGAVFIRSKKRESQFARVSRRYHASELSRGSHGSKLVELSIWPKQRGWTDLSKKPSIGATAITTVERARRGLEANAAAGIKPGAIVVDAEATLVESRSTQ